MRYDYAFMYHYIHVFCKCVLVYHSKAAKCYEIFYCRNILKLTKMKYFYQFEESYKSFWLDQIF